MKNYILKVKKIIKCIAIVMGIVRISPCESNEPDVGETALIDMQYSC
ncbi:hypothetical protein [uncultured Clostridium sp.]